MFGQNKKNAILHLIAGILLAFLGYMNLKTGMGFSIFSFILSGVMFILALFYYSRKDDF